MNSDFDGPWLAELSGVTKRFGKTVALDRLDLQVRPRELLAVLGPNGAGKTTAISLLLGLEPPDGGSVRLFGQSALLLEARRRVGVMMQEVHLAPELRVREQVDLVASYYPAPLSAAAAMEMTHTTSLAERPYGKLSGGQKRQTQFAMAVCGRPKLLFLDEPTVGLDVQARELMWATLRRLVADGSSIVLTTHYLEEAEALADRVAVLARGRVIATGTVDEMRGLVVRKQVSCSTTVAVQDVRAWPGVESADREQQRLHVTTSDAEGVVRRLLAADPSLRELEVRRAGLADAFNELTQEAGS
jgi:ABC-2 type transport system ATP-binding protein